MVSTTARRLTPSERIVLDSIEGNMTKPAIREAASRKAGRELPYSTVVCAISNLARWGMVEKIIAKPHMKFRRTAQ